MIRKFHQRKGRRRSEFVMRTGVYEKRNLDFGRALSELTRTAPRQSGAVMTFLGVARLESAQGNKKIRSLVMESYKKHADRVLNRICVETKRKFALNNIRILHAIGEFEPGEPVVLVSVSAPRRTVGFAALREAVERYKKEPALFKQEVYNDGTSAWIY